MVDRPPVIRIDLNSPVPVYKQIVDALRVLLVNGELAPGVKLPSVRRLALELGVHFNTVSEAYRILAQDGWLDLRHGSGATVRERSAPAKVSRKRLSEFRAALRSLATQMRAEGMSAYEIAAEMRYITEKS